MNSPVAAAGRTAGFGQGVVLVTAGFLPVLAIIALVPVVPTLRSAVGDADRRIAAGRATPVV